MRLWPVSTSERPKQLCDLMGSGSLLNMTLQRLQPLGSLVVVCGAGQRWAIGKEIMGLDVKVLTEPLGRNTAPAVGLVLAEGSYNGDEVLGFFPADHYIQNVDGFHRVLQTAEKLAQEGFLVTVGVTPTYAETGYGYIERAEGINTYQVKAFHEKPDIEKAADYFKSGNFFWNAGIFMATVDIWRYLMQEHMSDLFENIQKGYEVYLGGYPGYPNISIDYAIAEKCKRMAVVEGDFDWSDIGSWDSLAAVLEQDENGNVLLGSSRAMETYNCLARSSGKNVVLFGVENLIVVETEDTIMVCPRDRSQDIRLLVEFLK